MRLSTVLYIVCGGYQALIEDPIDASDADGILDPRAKKRSGPVPSERLILLAHPSIYLEQFMR
jgi:hypothetical protein